MPQTNPRHHEEETQYTNNHHESQDTTKAKKSHLSPKANQLQNHKDINYCAITQGPNTHIKPKHCKQP